MTVVHHGRIAQVNALHCGRKVAVVQVEHDRHRNPHRVNLVGNHITDKLKAAHVLGRPHRYLDQDRGSGFVGRLQNCPGPFKVVNIVGTHCVVVCPGIGKDLVTIIKISHCVNFLPH